LQADTDVLMQRIAHRDRPYERQMDVNYIDALNQTYETRIKNYPAGAVLTINTNELDYIRYSAHLDLIEQRIRQTLKLSPFQESLPIDI